LGDRAPAHPAANGQADMKLSLAERKVLTVLAQYPQGRTKTQVALLTGYSVKGGGFGNALSALRSKGYMIGSKDLQITDAGLAALGTWEPLPTGPALVDYWLAQLSKAERAILQVLVAAGGRVMTKQQVADATGYEASGGGFGNALSRLRTLELIEGRNEVRANDTLLGDSIDQHHGDIDYG
jgi:alkylated DNA nucleotide flippase Atl1